MSITKDETLTKSQFIQIIKGRDNTIIWHSLFGNPKIVSTEILTFLEIFSHPRQLSSVLEEYDCDENNKKAIQDLIASYHLIPKNFNEREFL